MKHITVVAEDRTGLLAEVTQLMEQANINIESIAANEDHGIAYIGLEVDRYDDALTALNDAGMQAMPAEVVLVRVADHPGGLAKISRRLADENINIRGMSLLERGNGWCTVAVTTNDQLRTREVLKDTVVEPL